MRRQIFRWGAAFAFTSLLATLMILSVLREPEAAPVKTLIEPPIDPRDPAEVSDVEVELILNKIREGDLHAMKEDLPAARKAWAEARRMGQGLWPIHEGLADSFARAELHDEALKEYEIAEKLVPKRLAAMRAAIGSKRGDVLAETGKSLEAVGLYLEWLPPARLALKLLPMVDKTDGAAVIERVARRAETHDPRMYAILAALHRKRKDEEAALEAQANYCIHVEPWAEQRNVQSIEALRKAKKHDLAIEVCRAWVKSKPQALHAYKLMGDLHHEAGREREAFVAYTSIVDVRPGDAGAHRMLAAIFREKNQLDDAIDQYEAARKARPEDRQNYTALFELYEEKGDLARADEQLLAASKRFGLSGDLRSKLVARYQARIDRLKADGKKDEVRAIRRRLGEMNVHEMGLFDLKIIMTWDAATHVDIEVVEPGGETVQHGHAKSKAGGRCPVHDRDGHGPEFYVLPKLVPGDYKIGAHQHGNGKSTVTYVILLHEDTPQEKRLVRTFEMNGKTKYFPPLRLPQ